MVRPWLDARGKEEGYLFNPILRSGEIVDRPLTSQALYDVIKHRSSEAGMSCKPHDLRRTFVTRLLDAGVDLNTARQLAGHSNVETTVKYDLRDEQHQRKALKSIG
jgi:integrase/recombinase XerD